MIDWKTPSKGRRFYVELFGWLALAIVSTIAYKYVANIREAINTSGINSEAVVTDVYFIKSSWVLDVRYRYKAKTYDAKGESPRKYSIGDSLYVRFSPEYPDEVFIIDIPYIPRHNW